LIDHVRKSVSDGSLPVVTHARTLQFERLDASFGDVLLNDGKGNFKWVSQKETGLEVKGMVRDLVEIPTENGPRVLFLRNDDYPILYKVRKTVKPIVKPLRAE